MEGNYIRIFEYIFVFIHKNSQIFKSQICQSFILFEHIFHHHQQIITSAIFLFYKMSIQTLLTDLWMSFTMHRHTGAIAWTMSGITDLVKELGQNLCLKQFKWRSQSLSLYAWINSSIISTISRKFSRVWTLLPYLMPWILERALLPYLMPWILESAAWVQKGIAFIAAEVPPDLQNLLFRELNIPFRYSPNCLHCNWDIASWMSFQVQ